MDDHFLLVGVIQNENPHLEIVSCLRVFLKKTTNFFILKTTLNESGRVDYHFE